MRRANFELLLNIAGGASLLIYTSGQPRFFVGDYMKMNLVTLNYRCIESTL